MARVRSPNYPNISLPEAIDRVRKVYDKEHTHKAPPEVIAKALGYNGLNGASMSVISALKKYGLLEEVGKEIKVSVDALTILVDPVDSRERQEAIVKAAFLPALFVDLREQYGSVVPSDENMRAFLLKKGFAQSAVDIPIRSYRETIAYVTENSTRYNVAPESDIEEVQVASEPQTTGSLSTVAPPQGRRPDDIWEIAASDGNRHEVYSLNDGRRVMFQWPSNMSATDYEDFESWIQLQLRKIKRTIQN
jgi:hypothetical protein